MAGIDYAAAGMRTSSHVSDPHTRTTAACTLGPDRQVRILSISPAADDHAALTLILDELPFVVIPAASCQEAAGVLHREAVGIVLCECDLPDGNWLEVLNQISSVHEKPLLIVTSRLADESLWAQVLNLGGYDLLAKPFSRQEVRYVLTSAWVQKANPVRGPRMNAAD